MGRWGHTERNGPKKILEYIRERGEGCSILFVGARYAVNYHRIIRQIRGVNHDCKITFSDQYIPSPKHAQEIFVDHPDEINDEDVYFVQLDVLEPPKTKSLWDCIVAFGLFSPAVIWSEDAKIALRNLTNITKNGGLIIASTREKFSPKFEQFIDEIDSGFSIQICTDYSSDIAFDKHAFAKGWKQRCKFTGHHYPGYEGHNTMIDAYLAYMKDQDSEKRTNFYITKQC